MVWRHGGGLRYGNSNFALSDVLTLIIVITDSIGIKSTKHAVYDLKYHLVWVPKYRKHIFEMK